MTVPLIRPLCTPIAQPILLPHSSQYRHSRIQSPPEAELLEDVKRMTLDYVRLLR